MLIFIQINSIQVSQHYSYLSINSFNPFINKIYLEIIIHFIFILKRRELKNKFLIKFKNFLTIEQILYIINHLTIFYVIQQK